MREINASSAAADESFLLYIYLDSTDLYSLIKIADSLLVDYLARATERQSGIVSNVLQLARTGNSVKEKKHQTILAFLYPRERIKHIIPDTLSATVIFRPVIFYL